MERVIILICEIIGKKVRVFKNCKWVCKKLNIFNITIMLHKYYKFINVCKGIYK